MMVMERYRAWLEHPDMPQELKESLLSMDSEGIHDSFYRDLSFGTGGLRGVLGPGSNRMNLFTVIRATRGLSIFLKGSHAHPRCIISCDSRIHSRDFAESAASVLADMGIDVLIFPVLEPTPVLSFAVRRLSASAGIMITASHNPAKYNGYKVYGPDGCQITPEAADRIQAQISLQPEFPGRLLSFRQFLAEGKIRYIDDSLLESYYDSILMLRTGCACSPLHVVYSPLNGTGNIPVREILRRMGGMRVDTVPEQELPDGRFPTCPSPNPEVMGAMELAVRKTLDTGADLCFATDPDCDRMGAGIRIGNDVKLISGNDMGILMLDHLCRHLARCSSPPPVVVKTIVTTDMAEPLCAKYGIELRNVLTGFKYIGEQIALLESMGQKDRFLFGFEESYGYLSGTDVRDKDGVNAALLLCEMAAYLKSQHKTLTDRLQELQNEFGLYAQRLLTYEYEGDSGSRRMREIMNSLRRPPADLNEPLFRNASRTDYLNDDTGLPRSNVLSFRLSEKEKIVIRPSGTEPKLKAYLFSAASSADEARSGLDRLQSILDRLLK